VLVVQHIWSRWTKQVRAAAAARPRPEPAYPLPLATYDAGPADVLAHEVRRMETEDFRTEHRIGQVRELHDLVGPHDQATTSVANLRWQPVGRGAFALTLMPPWEGMRATAWPAHLPSPLITLEPGQSAVIDWNGRFRSSMGGSNRSFFYEQHRYAAACVDGRPDRDLFLTHEPRKVIDLTTRIY